MLEIINLRKEFNSKVAVDDISFKVEKGKIFGLLGPNGAGKTTTIRIILDILKPTTGEIKFDGKIIDSNFLNETGYLPEERGLYKKSKILDVICYFAELKGLQRNKAVNLAIDYLNKLEIDNYKKRKIEELSKGNQQKVQFIISIIHNPKILIFDEPFSGFDPINQQLIKDIILSLVNEGKIIILSTHQMELAEKLCTDILLINDGKEVCSGNINDVKKKFGTEMIKIEFSGDVSKLSGNNFIADINAYQNYAEISLQKNTKPTDFLKSIIDKVEVRSFSVIEPTLNQIFIDTIKKSNN